MITIILSSIPLSTKPNHANVRVSRNIISRMLRLFRANYLRHKKVSLRYGVLCSCVFTLEVRLLAMIILLTIYSQRLAICNSRVASKKTFRRIFKNKTSASGI